MRKEGTKARRHEGTKAAGFLMGLMALAAVAAAAPPIPPVYRGTEIVPWVEVNSSRTEYIVSALRGIKAWREAGACREIIVTTTPGQAVILRKLLPGFTTSYAGDVGPVNLPSLRMIPGVKPTGSYLTQLGDASGWEKMSLDVAPMLELTGHGSDAFFTFVWEMESVMTAHRTAAPGTNPVDWPGLKRGLQFLPRTMGNPPVPIRYLVYPAVTGGTDTESEKLYRNNVRTWVAVFDDQVQFIDHTFHPRSKGNAESREFLHHVAWGPTCPMLYFYDGLPWSWQYAQAAEALKHAGYPSKVIVYPGRERFAASALAIEKALWP